MYTHISTARATRLPHRCQSDPDRCTARSENLRGGTLVRKRRESDAVGPFRRAACTRLQRASCTAFRCLHCTNRSSSSPSHINLVSQGIHRTEAPASVKDAYIPPRRKTIQAACNVCMYVQPLVRTLHPLHTWRIVRGPRMAVAYLACRPDCAADTNGGDTCTKSIHVKSTACHWRPAHGEIGCAAGFQHKAGTGRVGVGTQTEKAIPR